MEMVLTWQIAVAMSVVISRIFSTQAMITVAWCWSAFTILAVWAHWLVLLQLGSVWGTVWLITALFGGQNKKKKKVDISGDTPAVNKQLPVVKQHQKIAHSVKPDDVVQSAKIKASITASHNQAIQAAPPSRPGILKELNEALEKKLENQKNMLVEKLETQRANGDLFIELSKLRISVEAALDVGERQKTLTAILTTDPTYAEFHQRALSRLTAAGAHNSSRKLPVFSVTLRPVQRSSLPIQAIEERVQKLQETLGCLVAACTRVGQDAALLTAIDLKFPEPFLTFVTAQTELLKQHLLLLAPDKPEVGNSIHRSTEAPVGHLKIQPVKPFGDDPNAKGSIHRGTSSRIEGTTSVSSRFVEVSRVMQERYSEWIYEKSSVFDGAAYSTNKDEIKAVANELRIPHLIHFTQCENLPHILHHGLMSVNASSKEQLLPARNDLNRYDAQLDGTSLSVAFPNYRMFWKYRQLKPKIDWVVLLISPQVLWQKDCAFYRYNAADSRMIRQPRDQVKSAQALRDMFSVNEEGRETWLRSYDPTDSQAEIMVYEAIEPSLVKAIVFETDEAQARHLDCLAGQKSFYAGKGKGLFASRRYARTN